MAIHHMNNLMQDAEVFESQEPLAILQSLTSSSKYPVEAFPPVIKNAVLAIHKQVQAPIAMCAQSLLAAATVSVQGMINVETFGGRRPVSNFFLTIGASGERKSACDKIALKGLREFEVEEQKAYAIDISKYMLEVEAYETNKQLVKKRNSKSHDDLKSALANLEDRPKKPIHPLLLCDDPTFAGLIKQLEQGYPCVGIFNDEGGQFLGGHGMRSESRQEMLTGLSRIWDGEAIRRTRVKDDLIMLPNRRVSVHLMVQPQIAQELLNDGMAIDQGFLSRFLVCYPESMMGYRVSQTLSQVEQDQVNFFQNTQRQHLNRLSGVLNVNDNELKPKTMRLSPEARGAVGKRVAEIEAELKPEGSLRPISGIANKACELAIRIAGVLSYFSNPDSLEISSTIMMDGIKLSDYYLSEAKRLYDSGLTNPLLQEAELLRHWLVNQWKEPCISVSEMCQFGPSKFRDKLKLLPLTKILEEYGWLVMSDEPITVREKKRTKGWHIKGQNNDESI